MIQRPDSDSNPLLPPLEAVLFVAAEAISTRRLGELLGEETAAVKTALDELQGRWNRAESGVHLVEIAGGWRLLTNPACADAVAAVSGRKARDSLSPAALETLAIVAYKQPASRAEIERIRGVAVGPVLRHLLELDLIRVVGREEGLGRALLYATTKLFLDHFGLASIRDLPASLEI